MEADQIRRLFLRAAGIANARALAA